MTELLAIFGPDGNDTELLDQITRLHPRRVTVLIDGADPDWAYDESPEGDELRDRLAALMTGIELGTGATVTGLAGDRVALSGWRLHREVSVNLALAA